MSKTNILRDLLRSGSFLHLPSVYDPITARQVEAAGFEATYVGGYVSGASRAIRSGAGAPGDRRPYRLGRALQN